MGKRRSNRRRRSRGASRSPRRSAPRRRGQGARRERRTDELPGDDRRDGRERVLEIREWADAGRDALLRTTQGVRKGKESRFVKSERGKFTLADAEK